MTETNGALDPTTRAFWDGAADGRLVVQRCPACGHHQLYPRPFCLVCDAPGLTWVETRGLGTIYSCVTVHLTVHDDMPPPYTVGVVEIDEGPRLLARVPATAAIGDRVVARWRPPDGDARPSLSFVEVGDEPAEAIR